MEVKKYRRFVPKNPNHDREQIATVFNKKQLIAAARMSRSVDVDTRIFLHKKDGNIVELLIYGSTDLKVHKRMMKRIISSPANELF